MPSVKWFSEYVYVFINFETVLLRMMVARVVIQKLQYTYWFLILHSSLAATGNFFDMKNKY